jgi:hypothetical protein
MQGVGTIFQFAGVLLFLGSMSVCCGSSLLNRDTATHTSLTNVGWRLGAKDGPPRYSAQRAATISLMASVFFGLAVACIGLGLQAQNRFAPTLAAGVTALATAFWIVHAIFFAQAMHSVVLTSLCVAQSLAFGVLLLLAIGAVRDVLRDPPPAGLENLPSDYKIPYSHMHVDPPEVRLASELEQRRQRLAVQQRELQMLEARLARKMKEHENDPPS